MVRQMLVMNKVQQIVRETLESRFPKLQIVRIEVAEDTDDDDNTILRIQVIFEAKEGDFDPAKLREMPRLIMPKLKEAKETGFPLFSFISKSDFGTVKTARA
jgi:hypothetical protein